MELMIGGWRESGFKGGSEETMDNVLLHWGHKKQFRAHLSSRNQSLFTTNEQENPIAPILFGSHTGTGYLKKAIWTVIPADLDRYATIATHIVALFTEIQGGQRMESKRVKRMLRKRCSVRRSCRPSR